MSHDNWQQQTLAEKQQHYHEQGEMDFRAGKALDENPYNDRQVCCKIDDKFIHSPTYPHEAWRVGWLEAKWPD